MIFSRREIQGKLDLLRKHFDAEEIINLTKRLNTTGRKRISAMWELVIIASLSTLGEVKIEPPLPNGRKPDIFFKNKDGVSFFADVTCVSDEGLDKNNPVNLFNECLMETLLRLGFPPGGHDIRISSKKIKTSKGEKIELKLPPISKIPKFISDEIKPILIESLNKSERYAVISIDTEEVGLSLSIDKSGGMFNCVGHASYSQPSILDKNTLFNALKSKARQLKEASATKGIIVCDDNSRSLSSKTANGIDYARLICIEFFRQHESIDFIVIISTEEKRKGPLAFNSKNISLSAQIIFKNSFLKKEEIKSIFQSAIEKFPTPINTPTNAALRAKESGYGPGLRGGYNLSGNKIKISSRVIMEVLSGKISLEEFNSMHDWNQEKENFYMINPFERNLANGNLPVKITIDTSQNHDDDWIEFEFGKRDAAVSDFH